VAIANCMPKKRDLASGGYGASRCS
jgi:hypothetical protein